MLNQGFATASINAQWKGVKYNIYRFRIEELQLHCWLKCIMGEGNQNPIRCKVTSTYKLSSFPTSSLMYVLQLQAPSQTAPLMCVTGTNDIAQTANYKDPERFILLSLILPPTMSPPIVPILCLNGWSVALHKDLSVNLFTSLVSMGTYIMLQKWNLSLIDIVVSINSNNISLSPCGGWKLSTMSNDTSPLISLR